MQSNVVNLDAEKHAKELMDSEERREKYIKENYVYWNEAGRHFRKEREKRHLSLNEVSELLGTSASRVRRFEIGEPVSQADHLKTVYEMLFDYVDLHHDLFNLWERHV